MIVESPAKARTVGRFLGKGYTVKASVGHVRDLLKSQLSVDVEKDFEPTYRVTNDQRKTVKDLQGEVGRAKEVYLATDPDREGEAIAWHLVEATGIEPERSTARGLPRDHQGRRGRGLRPPAPAEHGPGQRPAGATHSRPAGGLQDQPAAVGEGAWPHLGRPRAVGGLAPGGRARAGDRGFVAVEYWSIHARLAQQDTRALRPRPDFLARLHRLRGGEVDLRDEADAQAIVDDLTGAHYLVTAVRQGERRRQPAAPFTTSTLQQEASRKLGFGARQTMRAAQQLYEGIDLGHDEQVGLITYMRTDSVNVAKQAQDEARVFIAERYGPEFLPPSAPVYKTRAKGAQEAHEAVRPTGMRARQNRLPAI